MSDIVGTMLHELTHNIHGPHNDKFYKFLDKIKERFEEIQYNPSSVTGYVCEENKLGRGNTLFRDYKSIRDKRIEALGKAKYKSEFRKLGGNSKTGEPRMDPKSLRLRALEAAEQRLRDSKSCNSKEQTQAEPEDDELEIVDVDSLQGLIRPRDISRLTGAKGSIANSTSGPSNLVQTQTRSDIEVIDLTSDTPEAASDSQIRDQDVVVLD
ncbi:hypothetical protein PSN45_003422 [Yamadazyma tenuis]|nr:hypothetical protein PSN45_003422 [Yamadazyma tenuis]